ncbi:MAG TPA: hypothetical protein VMP00_07225 [Burkholderiales bacterium]|nr:hypothetical protein [Burkholderiales bacterium]
MRAAALVLCASLFADPAWSQSQIELRARDVRAYAEYSLRFQHFYAPVLAVAAAAKDIEQGSADLAAGTLTPQAASDRASALRARATERLAELERMHAQGRFDPPNIRNAAIREPALRMREGIDSLRQAAAELLARASSAFEAVRDGGVNAAQFDSLTGLLEIDNAFIALSSASLWEDHPQKALNEAMLSLNAALTGLLQRQGDGSPAAAAHEAEAAILRIGQGRQQAQRFAEQIAQYGRADPHAAEVAQAFEAVYRESFDVEQTLAESILAAAGGADSKATATPAEIARLAAPPVDRRVALYARRLGIVSEVERIIR